MPTPMEYGRQEKKYRGAGGGPGKGPELVIPNPELKICLKELRESYRWLRWIPRAHLLRPRLVEPLAKETDELVSNLVRGIQTARTEKTVTGLVQSPTFGVRCSIFGCLSTPHAGIL